MVKAQKDEVATESFVYGVVSRAENRLENAIDQLREEINQKFNKVMEALADLSGQFRKFDEEQTILSHRVSKHNDRIEKLEKVVFKSP